MSCTEKLELKVDSPLKLKDLKYKFIVKNNQTKKISFSEIGNFDDKGFTKLYEIYNLNTSLIYEIYLRGEVIQTISVKAYPNKNNWSLFKIKLTKGLTKKATENIQDVYIKDDEAAWYLVKNKQTVLELTGKLFKAPLTPSDWEILQKNNPHLGGLPSMKYLNPGQVIVLSNVTSGKRLDKYKKQAQEAQKKLDELTKDPKFDAEFFAEYYEFFFDALHDPYSGLTKLAEEDMDFTEKYADNINGSAIKSTLDGAFNLADSSKEKVLKNYGAILEELNKERAKNSRLANPKKFAEFKRANAKLFQDFDNAFSRRIFHFDTGIQTPNLRRHLHQTAFVRGQNYKGGLDGYLKNINDAGKISKSVKAGGWIFLGMDAVEAGLTIHKAYKTGDNDELRKASIVEPLKIAGSAGGASLGGYAAGAVVGLVIGVGTGGLGLVVIGLAVAVGGYAGGEIGKAIGENSGTYIADQVNEYYE